MRSSKSRSRNKSNRQRSIGNVINRVFDSSGPEGKVRGTPQQIIEKYLALARDAQLGNDRVAEQNFLQHAEHYTRMLGEAQRELAREQEERQRNFQNNNGQNGGQNNGQNNGQNGNPRNQNEGGQGGQQGNRDRGERDQVAAQGTGEQPRYDGAPVMMPDFFAAPESVTEEGSGLVETPEARQSAAPEAPRSAPRNRRVAPEAAPVETGAEAPAAPEAPAESAEASENETAEAKPAKTSRPRAPRKPKSEGAAPKPRAPRAKKTAPDAPPEAPAAE
ncbi:DUF4167 domain-containing protein [Rhodobacter sp. JA431]|uniref:DUF4167 domain-containing protein n=1 Tax=Rhodobacter sp. JA431 TaxID=570013 RepID=UPI000BE40709|nr:DUF4167 domain-containing protein [Rhodobacter sp. JA431]